MDTHRTRRERAAALAVACILAVAVACAASTATAAGTGDHPAPEPDRLTRRQEADRGRDGREGGVRAAGARARRRVAAARIDAPRRFLYTPTHEQARDYWCGPATVQVIGDYFGLATPQWVIAAWLGTTVDGTMFTRIDDALRHFTDRAYYYYGGLRPTDVLARIEHSILAHGYPLALDVRINGAEWPNYVYDHSGHIVPCEGFSWASGTVRLNDVYQESRWYRNGGVTLGHTMYASSLIATSVYAHPQRAVVCAP